MPTRPDPIRDSIRKALLAATRSEERRRPFALSGHDHEARITLDRRLAAIVRSIDVPRVRTAGHGRSMHYPRRVFVRAARALERRLGWSPISVSESWAQLRTEERSPNEPLSFTGTQVDGPDVDLVELSGLELSEDEQARLWYHVNARDLLRENPHCEEILLEDFEGGPGQSDAYFEYECDDRAAFAAALRASILRIIAAPRERPHSTRRQSVSRTSRGPRR